MTQHSKFQPSQNLVSRFIALLNVDHPVQRLLALYSEWQTRHKLVQTFAHLSSFHLQDIGLIEGDVEATCTASYDQPASEALKTLAAGRIGNW